MSSFTRRFSVLLGSMGLALLLVSCGEKATPPALVAPQGPALGYAPAFGCDNVNITCLGTDATNEVAIEQFRVCKVYSGGTGPDVEIKLHADYVRFQNGPATANTGTYTLHSGECLTLWRNGEHVGTPDAGDTITVSETPVPGYTTTSQVTTIIRDQPNPGGPSTFTTTVGPVTNATSATGLVGGQRVPGVLVVFTNTAIPTNSPPVANANGPYTGVEGSPVTFSSAGTSDGDSDALTYLWDFGDGITSTTQNPVHTYADNGVYGVTLTVDDGHGSPATVTTTATITNLAPMPTATVAKASLVCGELASFTGSFTDAGINDQPWNWSIDWGDSSPVSSGTNALMATPIVSTHDYGTNSGPQTITLTVTDKDGGVGTATTSVTNECKPNSPPTAVANGPYTGVEGSPVAFNSTGSGDADGDVLTYTWDFGDGSTGTGANPSHTYADNGVYTVTLTVSDGVNPPVTVTTTATIVNANPAPTATVASATVTCGQLAAFTGTFTDAGINDQTWTWTINWGDGSSLTSGSTTSMATPITATHSYGTNSGAYTITLTVKDKDGGVGTATTAVTNSCQNPTAGCVAITAVKGYAITPVTMTGAGGAGGPYTFTATGLPAGLSISSAGVISGTPSVSGTFNYTVTVTDKLGNKSNSNCTVTVNVPPTAACVTINATKGKAIAPVTLVGTGGAGGPYAFSATGLPAGLTMSSGGTISGTPTVGGTFTYTVTITDKKGNKATFTCSVTVAVPDTTNPVCSVYSSASPPYMSYQDMGSGIVRLDVLTNLNSNYKLTITPSVSGMTVTPAVGSQPVVMPTGTVIKFPTGVTSLIKVSAIRVNTKISSQLTVKATDAAGNTVTCDPVETTLTKVKQDGGSQTFTNIPYDEHFITIENGGLRSIEINVNGTVFRVRRLSDDEVRTIDVGSAMKHNNKNTITLTPKGKKGETADVTIGAGQ